MSSSASGLVSSPTIYGKVDYGPTFGQVYRPLNTKRVVTAAGAVSVLTYDVFIIVAQTIPAAFNLQLPNLTLWMSQPYGGFDLTIKNNNFGFDGTILPFGSQKIDGLAQMIIGGGPGSVTFSPLNDFSGWMTL